MGAKGLLVEDMLNRGIYQYENIENLYETKKVGRKIEIDYDSPKTIYEWYEVTEWLFNKLKSQGYTVFYSSEHDCYYWGRNATGQMVAMDWIIQEIATKNGF